jgi:hypothetical protein
VEWLSLLAVATNLEQKRQRWNEDFDTAQKHILMLFHNRRVWLSIKDMWAKSGEKLELNNIVQNWFTSGYVNSQCIGIRRECDGNTKTSSLGRCLRVLMENPRIIDRERYRTTIRVKPAMSEGWADELAETYNEFAATPDAPYLDPGRIKRDLADLHAAARTTIQFTDKVVAHREALDAPLDLSWADLDKALNEVGKMLKRYFQLRRPGEILGNLTPDLPPGWGRPFQHAWAPDGLAVWASGKRLDDYVED